MLSETMRLDTLTFEKDIVTRDGLRLRLRPVEAGDAPALVDICQASTPDDVRMRFLGTIRAAPGSLFNKLSDYDHDRQIAMAAYDPAAPARDRRFLAVVRLILAPDDSHAEFAIMVRSDIKGHGLGHRLMREMLDWAVARRLGWVEGHVMAENRAMLRLAGDFGAVLDRPNNDFRTVRVKFDLRV